MAGEDEAKLHVWEESYKRSWDLLKQDSSLSSFLTNHQRQLLLSKRKLPSKTAINPKRGIIRNLLIILDLSTFMSPENLDLKPNRLLLSLTILEAFITEFYEENPLSCLSIMLMRNGLTELLTPFLPSSTPHIQALRSPTNRTPSGEMSLQNALEHALQLFSHVSSSSTREILFIISSLTSTDPGNIGESIQKCVHAKIRVSLVGLGGEMEVGKRASRATGGTYTTPLSESHYKSLVHQLIPPPPLTTTSENTLLVMGFPVKSMLNEPALCACHGKLTNIAFGCPRCGSLSCAVPCDCSVCGLTLVSSSLLARSYHHLFPVDGYEEGHADVYKNCFACAVSFQGQGEFGVFVCRKCEKAFCLDCDLFVHESLFNCPGCLLIQR